MKSMKSMKDQQIPGLVTSNKAADDILQQIKEHFMATVDKVAFSCPALSPGEHARFSCQDEVAPELVVWHSGMPLSDEQFVAILNSQETARFAFNSYLLGPNEEGLSLFYESRPSCFFGTPECEHDLFIPLSWRDGEKYSYLKDTHVKHYPSFLDEKEFPSWIPVRFEGTLQASKDGVVIDRDLLNEYRDAVERIADSHAIYEVYRYDLMPDPRFYSSEMLAPRNPVCLFTTPNKELAEAFVAAMEQEYPHEDLGDGQFLGVYEIVRKEVAREQDMNLCLMHACKYLEDIGVERNPLRDIDKPDIVGPGE